MVVSVRRDGAGVIICVKGIAGGLLVQRALQGRVCVVGRLFAYGVVCAAGFAGSLFAQRGSYLRSGIVCVAGSSRFQAE